MPAPCRMAAPSRASAVANDTTLTRTRAGVSRRRSDAGRAKPFRSGIRGGPSSARPVPSGAPGASAPRWHLRSRPAARCVASSRRGDAPVQSRNVRLRSKITLTCTGGPFWQAEDERCAPERGRGHREATMEQQARRASDRGARRRLGGSLARPAAAAAAPRAPVSLARAAADGGGARGCHAGAVAARAGQWIGSAARQRAEVEAWFESDDVGVAVLLPERLRGARPGPGAPAQADRAARVRRRPRAGTAMTPEPMPDERGARSWGPARQTLRALLARQADLGLSTSAVEAMVCRVQFLCCRSGEEIVSGPRRRAPSASSSGGW